MYSYVASRVVFVEALTLPEVQAPPLNYHKIQQHLTYMYSTSAFVNTAHVCVRT